MAEIKVTGTRRRPLVRVLLWLLLVLTVLLLCLAAYAYYVAHSALPQLDGTLRVEGLAAPVTVTRDGHGVPTIEAATLDDLFFAQGYVTAQDRLWQMDVIRRAGSGELSEIVGEDTLKLDREQRILGLRASAKKSLAMASPRDRSFFEAYARGVNAFIVSHLHHLPIEFHLLGYAPKPWQPEDSVVIANQMVKDLNYHYFYEALGREKILAKLGPELTADLYVNQSWHDHPPTVMREDLSEPNAAGSDQEDDDEEDAPDNSVTEKKIGRARDQLEATELQMEGRPVNGSNDWVVSGAHTDDGQASALERHAPRPPNAEPLVRSALAFWSARCCRRHPSRTCLASSLDTTRRIAWGFTNVGPTVTDLYIENVNAEGVISDAEAAGFSRSTARRRSTSKARPDVTIDVKITRHGPIISELVPGELRASSRFAGRCMMGRAFPFST